METPLYFTGTKSCADTGVIKVFIIFFSHVGMPASGGGTADNRAGEEAFELCPSASW